MSLLLAYDTETTGLPLFDQPSHDPRQPHIVQLGACLVDTDTRSVVAAIDVITRPDGWDIPADVQHVHGITTEYAQDTGVSEELALHMLLEFWREANPRTRLAHNESFDARIVRIALMRYEGASLADVWKAGPWLCTAKMATPIMKMPATHRMRAAIKVERQARKDAAAALKG